MMQLRSKFKGFVACGFVHAFYFDTFAQAYGFVDGREGWTIRRLRVHV